VFENSIIFWKSLLDNYPNIKKLLKIGIKMSKSKAKIKKIYLRF